MQPHEHKYNHYVPKFHLANFSGNNKFIDKCILSTGTIIRGASTKSTGGQDYLYGKDGKIEDVFRRLEGEWSNILRKIILTESIPSDPYTHDFLLGFIILSENRTLSKANDILEGWGEHYKVLARMINEQGKTKISDTMIQSIHAESSAPNRQLIQLTELFMDTCADLKISLIKNISELPFITSDYPVIKYNQLLRSYSYPHGYGYGQKGIQIFFPISPQLCLIMFDPIPYRLHNFQNGKFIIKNHKSIHAINTLIANYAKQELYFSSSTSNRTVNKILEQRRSNNLTTPVESFRTKDGYIVKLSEPSYMHHVDLSALFSIHAPFRNTFFYPGQSLLRPHAQKIKELDESTNRYQE